MKTPAGRGQKDTARAFAARVFRCQVLVCGASLASYADRGNEKPRGERDSIALTTRYTKMVTRGPE